MPSKAPKRKQYTNASASYLLHKENACLAFFVTLIFQEWDSVPYDSNYQLTDNYDVARKEWGGTWRIPTMVDLKKLYYACVDASFSNIGSAETSTAALKPLPDDGNITKGGIYWVPQNKTVDGYPYNVAGVLFVMMDDTNQRIFFPAAGNIQNVSRDGANTLCTYWSANVHANDLQKAYPLYIGKDGISVNQKLPRCYGFSIRPVSTNPTNHRPPIFLHKYTEIGPMESGV